MPPSPKQGANDARHCRARRVNRYHLEGLTMTPSQQYIKLYAADIRAHASHFKAGVSIDPEGYAARIIEGLPDADVKRMLADLKAEIKAVS